MRALRKTTASSKQTIAPLLRPNICRFEYGRTAGWWVRFERCNALHTRLFSDNLCGGKTKALEAATRYRNAYDAKHPKKSREPKQPSLGYIKREEIFYRDRNTGARIYYEVFRAWIRVAPKRAASTHYSIQRHGVRAAKRYCEQWLNKKQIEQKRNFRHLAK